MQYHFEDAYIDSKGYVDFSKPKEGLRYNEGKVRYDLIPVEWEEELAQILTMGAKKYADRNWELGMDWSKCISSLRRHLAAWQKGESLDPESGRHHLGHVAWNALALMTYEQRKVGKDDRHTSS